MIKGNKAQSMITVMLLLMILGVIVTLIVSSTITDTRKLLVQKSYERAYSLSEKYLTKLVSGNILGVSSEQISSALGESNSNSCDYDETATITDYTTPVGLTCNAVGTDASSIVKCARETSVGAKSLKIQTDEPVVLDYSKQPSSSITYNDLTNIHPKVHIRYSNAEAVQITYKYTEDISNVTTPLSASFIISNDDAYYVGAIKVPTGSNNPTVPTYPQTLVDIVNKGGGNSGPTVVNPFTSTDEDIIATLNSIPQVGSNQFTLDIEKLALNIKSPSSTLHTVKSIQIKFLSKTPTVVDFSIYHEGSFNLGTQKEVAYQFHRFKCNAFDSAYDTTNIGEEVTSSSSTGFGSARLEAYVPINKALPDLFDYSLFVGGGVGGNSANGYPVIINK